MPFKSKAQRRKFAQLLVDGRISDETYEEWNRSTGGKALPERVGDTRKHLAKKRPAKKRSAATRSTAGRKARRKAANPKPKAKA